MDFYGKLFEYIGLERFFTFFEELFDFYLRPKKFYYNFFTKPTREKLLQILTYACMLIGIGVLTLDEMSLREIIQILLLELSGLVFVIFVLFSSNYLASKLIKSKTELRNIISFAVLSKLLIAPIGVVFYGLFITRENYNYFFISNCFQILIYFYFFFFSSFIFYTSRKGIFLSIIFNLILLNVVSFVSFKLSIDEYTKLSKNEDQIIEERLMIADKFYDFYKVPHKRVLLKMKEGNVTFFTLATPMDSTAIGSIEDTDLFESSLQMKIDTLRNKIPQMKFERNKIFFTKTLELYQSIDTLIQEKIIKYTPNDIEKVTVYLNQDDTEAYKKVILPVPEKFNDKSFDLMTMQLELESKSLYAHLPLRIFYYLYPIFLI